MRARRFLQRIERLALRSRPPGPAAPCCSACPAPRIARSARCIACGMPPPCCCICCIIWSSICAAPPAAARRPACSAACWPVAALGWKLRSSNCCCAASSPACRASSAAPAGCRAAAAPGRAVRRFSSMFCSCDSISRAWSRGAAARQLAGAVEHRCRSRIGQHLATDRPAATLARDAALHLLRQRLQIAVERLAQLLHQPLDLGIGRVARERVLQLLLQRGADRARRRDMRPSSMRSAVSHSNCCDAGAIASLSRSRRSRCCASAAPDRRRCRRGRARAARSDRRGFRRPSSADVGSLRAAPCAGR